MAARRKVVEEGASRTQSEADELRRLCKLIALLLVKGEDQAEKIRVLTSAGFTAAEVAVMLDTTTNAVHVAAHRRRKRKS